MKAWRRFHQRGWLMRLAIKCTFFALVVVLTLYPKPWLLPTWIGRLSDMNAVLEPSHPGLEPLAAKVRAVAPPGMGSEELLRIVQDVVHERIPYAWDWDVWGVMDYLPTVTETLEQGREDCDGRAVVAASLLRRLGYEAWLVSDLKHTWVQTPAGETMEPGRTGKTLVSDERGTHAQISLESLSHLARGLAFGISVFPLTRELIILAAFCALAMHPWSSPSRRMLGCLLLATALALFRCAPEAELHGVARPVFAWGGLLAALAGAAVLLLRAGAIRSTQPPLE